MKILWNQFTSFCSNSIQCEKTFGLLQNLYSEKHRFYHNLGHIKFLFTLFQDFGYEIEDKQAVFFSIWFHDAIYEPQKKDNEKQSAKLACEELKKLSLPDDEISKIEKIILATERHSAENMDADGKLFLDFDLAILGAEDDVYDEYKNAIRSEYSFVPEEMYKSERKRILQNFLRRELIYFTKIMREKFEGKARKNIEREILEL